jgi:hypothetical protein
MTRGMVDEVRSIVRRADRFTPALAQLSGSFARTCAAFLERRAAHFTARKRG